MKRIEKNNWFINDNALCISLMNFFVKIDSYVKDNFIYCELCVFNSKRSNLTFNFKSLEEAIYFAENDISNSFTFKEVIEKYNNLYVQRTCKSKCHKIER